jgi:hypothetical protein
MSVANARFDAAEAALKPQSAGVNVSLNTLINLTNSEIGAFAEVSRKRESADRPRLQERPY